MGEDALFDPHAPRAAALYQTRRCWGCIRSAHCSYRDVPYGARRGLDAKSAGKSADGCPRGSPDVGSQRFDFLRILRFVGHPSFWVPVARTATSRGKTDKADRPVLRKPKTSRTDTFFHICRKRASSKAGEWDADWRSHGPASGRWGSAAGTAHRSCSMTTQQARERSHRGRGRVAVAGPRPSAATTWRNEIATCNPIYRDYHRTAYDAGRRAGATNHPEVGAGLDLRRRPSHRWGGGCGRHALSLPCAAAAVALLAEGAAAVQPPAGPALRAGVGGAVVRDALHRGGLAVGPVWLGARQAPRTDRAGRTCVQNTGTPEGGGDGSRNNDNSEPSKNICRTLELAFRKVWLRLHNAPMKLPAALKEFAASVAAYDQAADAGIAARVEAPRAGDGRPDG